jgi:class 3 adenylate cyclase/ActR/RegA family two-component response regulator
MAITHRRHPESKEQTMTNKPELLALDDNAKILKSITAHLNDTFNVTCARTLDDARKALFDGDDVRFSVVAAEMQLSADKDAGLILARELTEKPNRPEVIIFTAHPDFRHVSELMQAGTFGYLKKDGVDAFEQLKALCLKANERWHERFHRIPPTVLNRPIALLFGDLVTPPDVWGDDTWGVPEPWRRVIRREVKACDGRITKFAGEGFLAIFDTVAQAVKAAFAVQQAMTTCTADSPGHQLRASIHWGEVERMRTRDWDDITGPLILPCVQLADYLKPGQVGISQDARNALAPSEKFNVQDLGKISVKGVKKPIQVYTVMREVG